MTICVEDLMSPAEASKSIKVAKETLSIWRCTRRYNLPYVKIGSKVFYRRKDLEAFVEKRTVGKEDK